MQLDTHLTNIALFLVTLIPRWCSCLDFLRAVQFTLQFWNLPWPPGHLSQALSSCLAPLSPGSAWANSEPISAPPLPSFLKVVQLPGWQHRQLPHSKFCCVFKILASRARQLLTGLTALKWDLLWWGQALRCTMQIQIQILSPVSNVILENG